MKSRRDSVDRKGGLSEQVERTLNILRERRKTVDLDKMDWDRIYRAVLYQFGVDGPRPKLEELFEFRSSELRKIVDLQKQALVSSIYVIAASVLSNIAVGLFLRGDVLGLTVTVLVCLFLTVAYLVLYTKVIYAPLEREFNKEARRYTELTAPLIPLVRSGFTMEEIMEECLKRIRRNDLKTDS